MRHLIVRIAGQRFGIVLEEVGEVFVVSEFTRLFLCPPDAFGVLNLRGEIVPLFDPRPALGLGVLERAEGRKAVLVRPTTLRCALLVDEVEARTEEVPTEAFVPLDGAGLREAEDSASEAGVIRGVYAGGKEPLLLFDIAAFFGRNVLRALFAA